jgi:hypothetical protein
MTNGDDAHALEECRWAWANAGDIATNPCVIRYIGEPSHVEIKIATGATAVLPFRRDALGPSLAELEMPGTVASSARSRSRCLRAMAFMPSPA